MNTPVNEYDVFISYSHRDAAAAELLATRLSHETGLRVWMDHSRLKPGFSWRDEIETAMNASTNALIVWGPQGLGPVQRQERDLSYAIRDTHQNFQVIYCLLPNSPPPQGTWANVDTWIRFVSSLDESNSFAQLVAAIKREAPPHTLIAELPNEPAPYRGLAAFATEDARFFFGRAAYAEEMLERLTHHPFVALLGASGSGKTSLVQAGLIPRLNNYGVPRTAWQWLLIRPGPHPLRSLARSLTRLQLQSDPLSLMDTILERLLANKNQLAEIVQSFLPEQGKLVLVVDRLEEIFTLCEADDERQAFLDALITSVRLNDPPVRIVTTMRADFYSQVGRYPDLANEVVSHQIYLMPMAEQQVAEIIEAPATQVGAIFEKGLAKRVESDAHAAGEVVLPLLQHTLDLLWRKRRGRWLTWDAYEEIGGVAGALRYHAERVIDGLNPEERNMARRLFMRLIWLDEQTGTMAGRRVEKTVLVKDSASRADERVLQRLADERLIVLRGQGELATAELAHDTLPLHWERLRGWMQEDRDFLLWRQRLRSNLTEWVLTTKDEGALLRVGLLEAERWLASRPDDLNPSEQDFIRQSLALRKRERLARDTRRRRIMVGLAAGFLIAVLLSVVALVQRERARQASLEALSNKLAAQATLYSTDRLDLALLLGLEARRAGGTKEARSIFLGGLIDAPHLESFLHGHSQWVSSVAFSPDGKTLASGSDDKTIILWDVGTRKAIEPRLLGHSDQVLSVAFSPDGKNLASGSRDGTIILWDIKDHKQIGEPLKSHAAGARGAVLSVAFSPDGRTLASSDEDKNIVLWDVAGRKPLKPGLPEQANAVQGVVFSPDGKTLASASGGTITLWDVAKQSPKKSLVTDADRVWSVAFSPDGKTLAAGGADKLVTLWDVATGSLVGSLAGHSDKVLSVSFSSDGKTVASGSLDNTVILWDVMSRQRLDAPFKVHADAVTSVAFSPDGKTLASGSRDNKVILWDVAEYHHLLKGKEGHKQPVWVVVFSPDGKRLASGSTDKSVIVWDVETRTEIHTFAGHADTVTGLAFSPNGRVLASCSRDGNVILWDVDKNNPQPPRLKHNSQVHSVVFSPDGKTLAAGLADGTIVFWDAESYQRRDTLNGGHSLWALAFSPDGKTLASGSQDGTITLWDVTTRKPLGTPLVGHNNTVTGVAFSPDGKILASISSDKSIVLWNVEKRVPLGLPLRGHSDVVLAIAFSPDGKTLASGSQDRTIILWDVATGRPIGRPLAGHKQGVESVSFSPDGRTLASGSDDKSIVLWDINLDFDPNRACGIANRNLTQAEWDQFIGTNKTYECTCPNLVSGQGAPQCNPTANR